ncbi:MAG: bifunctional phosphoribosylaminoimidazolecarboxamide formyltransferase/inosine monophosphate cyclohydrolase [Elusimicrobia bacterium CG08_land_8_20_14_0_20_51_18]|nr:MAG: bifunctional phosphoribosylaminoimidazolecarboxamide formyltransferase/inosine monophosphate cyclohydrolase [Elusimicrobia bacterium CG08_land_8_20_14_0_20_51_18]
MNICVFASGRGSNFGAILERIKSGRIKGAVKLLISNKAGCGAKELAAGSGVPFLTLKSGDFSGETDYAARLEKLCRENRIDLVCLAGYMAKLPAAFVEKFRGKIINVHPALLPSFGGKGFYGENVHKAVLKSGAKVSGVTVHFVDPEYDSGPIIAQETVKVYAGDTPETLAARILKTEHELYPEIVGLFSENRIKLEGGKAVVLPPAAGRGIKTALLSVSDKTGLVEFAGELEKLGVEIISTGGTYKTLRENGISSRSVEAVTGFPEILEGRVKTLNNKIFGGILFKRNDTAHLKELTDNEINGIDLVVVNLYPFREIAAKEENWSDKLVENIDIGGVALLRAAAKNYRDVAVVCGRADYKPLLEKMKSGGVDEETRKELAVKAFRHTSEYDSAIYAKLSSGALNLSPEYKSLHLNKIFDLRYGENPHQKAGLYSLNASLPFEKLHGKELSYNNILDAYGSVSAVSDFEDPACVIFKHVTPCGAARGENAAEAFEKAWSCDPLSAFGGIIAVNRKMDSGTAAFLSKKFIELVIAPEFDKEALALLRKKPNLRILRWREDAGKHPVFKSLGAEFLVSESDNSVLGDKWETVSGEITEEEKAALKFAFTCVKHVRSNGIVLSDGSKTLGIGAGQMSRVDSVFMAGHKYSEYLKKNPKPELLVMGSDAFFPFEDAVEEARRIGVSAIIQPGGSVRDGEVIEAAKKLGVKMVLTGIRHFKH